MADDKSKKPKINLKDRLGKTNIGTQSVPLPVPGSQPGGAPQGIAPPPGITPGIPVPPFGQAKPAVSEPPPPKPTVVQQTIKVEVGEEIIKEREKAKRTTILVAAGTAVAGIIIGWAVGDTYRSGQVQKDGIAKMKAVSADLKASNEKLKELEALLADAREKFKKKEYPAELAGALGGLNVPFDSTKVDGRIVSVPGRAVRLLLDYASSVEKVNESKDTLKKLLDAAKDPVVKGWKEEKEPVMNFSITFRADQKGVIAEFVPTKDPFDISKDWPANYSVMKTERGKPVEKKVSRYTKGDLPGTDVVIPVDPTTTAAYYSKQDMIARVGVELAKSLAELEVLLKGSEEDPTNPKVGVIEKGDGLMTELQKVTQGG